MSSKMDAVNAIPTLRPFVGRTQLRVMGDGTRGEEGQFFIDKIAEMANRVESMPGTYGQDGKGDEAVAYLHYFRGNMDWYITEKDMATDTEVAPEQIQAFGLADLGYGGELGYISIAELLEHGVELDLYFTPKTLRELNAKGDLRHAL